MICQKKSEWENIIKKPTMQYSKIIILKPEQYLWPYINSQQIFKWSSKSDDPYIVN